MTRIESGFMSVNKQLHVFEEVIGSALRQLAPVLGKRRVQVSLPEDFPLVPMDDVLLQQVFINLIENAQKYSPPDTIIEIAAHIADRSAIIEVSDRGQGLPEGQEQRVFEKFFRGHAVGERRHGTGLGLAICRAIVTAHSGTITAENRSGGGAIIRITLPLAAKGEH
jgi:two-component system sensor histidine kinase KdpD